MSNIRRQMIDLKIENEKEIRRLYYTVALSSVVCFCLGALIAHIFLGG